MVDNRESIRQTLVSVRDVSGSINPIIARDLPKLEKLVDGAEMSRARLDRVLYSGDKIANEVSDMLTHSRAEIERSVTNFRDASDWANKLVQKIFANPLVLTPFYKPNHEDLRVQAVYDTALVYMKGASDLHDAIKTLDSLTSRPNSPQQQEELRQLRQKVQMVSEQMNELSTRMADGLKRQSGNGRSDRTIR